MTLTMGSSEPNAMAQSYKSGRWSDETALYEPASSTQRLAQARLRAELQAIGHGHLLHQDAGSNLRGFDPEYATACNIRLRSHVGHIE